MRHVIENIFLNPRNVSVICWSFVLLYYILSWGFIRDVNSDSKSKWWKKNGFFDKLTSFFWLCFSVVLVGSLLTLELTKPTELTLGYVVGYYILFVFLFAFCYALIDWHRPGMLADISPDLWHKEFQYVIISFQTQSTLGYTRARPNHFLPELISCIQVLLGIFFIVTSISKLS
jgi:hypothetical protein